MCKLLKVAAIDRIRTATDGEGVTTLVVSMGCPLRCAYCINPFTWDDSETSSKEYSVDELYEALKIDNLYFLATGGGVMFGGGEPLLNSQFIAEFIRKYRNTGWKFYIETSLSVPLDNLKEVTGLIDYYYVDTKDMDEIRYRLYTQGDYELFINNLKYLIDTEGSSKISARVPIIPQLHNNKEFEENVIILKNLGIETVDVFNYIIPDTKKGTSLIAIENKERFLSGIKKK